MPIDYKKWLEGYVSHAQLAKPDWKQIATEYMDFQHKAMSGEVKCETSLDLWVFDWLKKHYECPKPKPKPEPITRDQMKQLSNKLIDDMPSGKKMEGVITITGTEQGKFRAVMIIAETEELAQNIYTRMIQT